MRIGIDIDEVVVEYIRHFLKFCEINLERKFVLEDISEFNLWRTLDISREEVVSIAKNFNEKNLFLELNFVEGFKDAINFLSKENELFFVTSRPIEIKEKTFKFFKEHFPESNFEIIFSDSCLKKESEKTKADICKELGIKILVEDRRKYALDCAENNIKVFLMDKPWNRNCEHENIIRVKNWKEILERLNEN